MKIITSQSKIGITIALTLFVFCLNAQSWQWAKRVGSSGDNAPFATGNQDELIHDVKVDKVGNVYAVGEFFINPVFNNTEWFGQTTPANFGKRDAYLVKYSACGKTLWWRRMGSTDDDAATSLVLDKNGNVLVTGYCSGNPAHFGDGVNDTIVSNGVFLAKFDTAGNFSNMNYVPQYKKLFITSQGDYLVTSGLYSARINTLGVVTSTYAHVVTTPYYPTVNGIALDKNDNLYISGSFNNTVNIGPGTILLPTAGTLIPNTNAFNSLIMKFSPNGSMLWYQRGNSSVTDILGSCTIDTSGTKIATGGAAWNGSTVWNYYINGGAGTYGNTFFLLDASNGTFLSARTGSANFQGAITPAHTDRDNNFHCTGRINGFLAFNSTTYTSTGGQYQNCIGKFDAGGNFMGINMLPQGGGSNERITALDMSEQGNIYIGGMFGGTLDSLGTAVSIKGGSEDGFVAKYGFACGSTSTALTPLPPTSLTAVYQPSLSNVVNWQDNAQFETGYQLWCIGGNMATYSLIATLPANATTYTHSNLSYTTTYCYKARAINSTGPSVYTNVGCAATPAAPSTTNTGSVGIQELGLLADVSAYPNPTAGEVNLHFVSTGKTANIEVMDLSGRLVYSEVINTRAGENDQQLQLPKAKGLYLIKLSTDNTTVIRKVVVE